MWKDTAITRRLKLAAPIVQGPFGSGLSAVDLVVAVSESGGLGSFGVHHLDGGGIRQVAGEIRARTARPFALNLWLPLGDSDDPQLSDARWSAACELLRPYFIELGVPMPARPARFGPRFEEQLETVLELKPPVFSFIFGVPAPHVLERCRRDGIVTVGTATTPAEAKLLDEAGVDAIVATGFEAGGHRVSFLMEPEDCLTGTLALVPQVVDTVKAPVIAAGGMADGRGIAAALELGASAAQIGTAFLACEESNAAPLHRDKLFSVDARRTTLTRAFTGRLARSVHNGFIDAMRGQQAVLAPYPVHAWLTARLRGAALAAGRTDLVSLWSGQGAPLLKHRRARELFASLVAETDSALGSAR
ncbi:MAG TPA: nitronate monooxygenase [Steroidobacteraceae bacterium]|jgi:nitronate monooxygenase|nr:nitronate monooxygenase [Steroidobacteraceae bacterium]